MTNVNDLGYGTCPGCKKWKELSRYHPKDAALKRAQKPKYCARCIQIVKDARTPFYELKKAISSHKAVNGHGDYNFQDIMDLIKQQGSRCAYCGTSMAYKVSLDHIIPRKFGGKNFLANIILTCVSCNSAKQHFEPFYFLRRKGYLLTEYNIKRIKGAYDEHDYECSCSCQDCRGKNRPKNNGACEGCEISPERYISGKVQPVQKSAPTLAASKHDAIRPSISRVGTDLLGFEGTIVAPNALLHGASRNQS